jgi:hypothetical protein
MPDVSEVSGQGAGGQTAGAPLEPIDQNTTLPRVGNQAFSRMGRTLTEEEFSQSGTLKLALDSSDRFAAECDRLRHFEEDYHKADKDRTVLKEKVRGRVVADICLGAGGVLAGLSIAIWQETRLAPIVLAVGLFLMSVPIWALRGEKT